MSEPTAPRAELVELLEAHERSGGHRDLRVHCACGWTSHRTVGSNGREVVASLASARSTHRTHLADVLIAAGWTKGAS